MQEFHAFQVSPGSEHSLEVPEGQGYHLSIVALPYNQSTGRSTLYVSVDGKSFAVGTVDAQRNIMQVTTDLIFNFEQKAVFQVKGTSAVHCVGYRQELDAEDEDMPFGFDDSEDEDGPLKLPVEQAHTGATVEQLDSDDDNEEDDLDDEEMSDEETNPAAADNEDDEEMSDDEEDDDDDEDDEEEDDEEDDEELAPTAADPTQAGPSSDDEEDDEDDEEEDDEEEDDEEEDDEEEDDEEEDDEEEMMPPTKASRPEARNSQSGASPAKSNSSPQQRGSQGSPQQRGTPNRSSQGRRSH